MPHPPLTPVSELRSIRGIPFPAGVSFRQLIVTGPPGTGKTTMVSAIGGWPDEGFVDLTARSWWRSRVLALRPRQIHLGFPFRGHRQGLSMFEPEWNDFDETPSLELDRIQLPPPASLWSPRGWRTRYVFDFLLPPADEVFAARTARQDRQSHRIDEGLSLERVTAQLEAYWSVAAYLHHAGLRIYIRDAFGAPPKTIDEPAAAAVIAGHRARGDAGRPRRSLLESYLRRVLSPSGYRMLDRFERVELRGTKAMIPRRTLPVEIELGPQRLRVYAERPRRPKGEVAQAVRVLDPSRYFSGIAPFLRLLPGEIGRIPDGSPLTPDLPSDIPPRLEIGNEGGWLTVVDLDSPTGTVVAAIGEAAEAERLPEDRLARLHRVRTLLEGMPPALPPEAAAEQVEQAIEVLAAGAWRPRNREGRPGALVEVPDGITPIIVGDLHAQVDNLLLVLIEGRYLDALESGDAALILLGDAVHREDEELEEMDSSLLMMDILTRLTVAFPGRVHYLRGNHDTFSEDMTKGGISQGRLWREKVREERGEEGVERMERLYALLPYVATGSGFLALHAGPPRGSVSRQAIIDAELDPRLVHQLTWNRVQSPRNPGGYTKRDVRNLQKAVGVPKPSRFIVSHNPGRNEGTVIHGLGGINRHDLVYSAKRDRVSVMTRIDGSMVALTYPALRLVELLEGEAGGAGG